MTHVLVILLVTFYDEKTKQCYSPIVFLSSELLTAVTGSLSQCDEPEKQISRICQWIIYISFVN